MAAEDRYPLSLRGPLQVIHKWLWVVVLLTVVFTLAAAGFSLLQTPMYEASIRLIVGQERHSDEPGGDLQNVVTGLQQLTQTIAEDIASRPVANAVIQRLSLSTTPEDFLAHLRVEQIPRTQLIQVYYRDPSPERAQQIANAIGEVYSEQASEVSPSANNPITVTVREWAEVPDGPVSPTLVLNSGLALIVGLMFGLGVAFLGESLGNSWRPAGEVEQFRMNKNFAIGGKKEIKTKRAGAGR